MNKIKALFTTGSGLTLVALFLYGGLSAILSHITGNPEAVLTALIALLGMYLHPTNMVAGKSIKS